MIGALGGVDERLRRRTLVLLLLGAAVFFTMPGAASPAHPLQATAVLDHPASQDLAWFNAQRRNNGLPAGIVENPTWSARCDKHITYMEKTHAFGHHEDPRSPYYSQDGDWGGSNSVLSWGDTWTSARNPWETAPIHLAQLMSPQLAEMGIADRDGYVCATTWPGFDRPLPLETAIVTYPGSGSTIYARESPAESPFTPEDIVGIAGDTGPNLYIYEWGQTVTGDETIASAQLTGVDGNVSLRWVDHTTAKIGPYLPEASGILMPVHPLKPGARYEATVTMSDGASRSWTFETQRIKNVIQISGRAASRHGRSLAAGRFFISSSASNIAVTVTLHNKPLHLNLVRTAHTVSTRSTQLRAGSHVCATSGGGTTTYSSADACKTL